MALWRSQLNRSHCSRSTRRRDSCHAFFFPIAIVAVLGAAPLVGADVITGTGAGAAHVTVNDDEAIALTRLGFPVGPSSGLNFRAALEVHARLGDAAAQVVTVFPGRMERYFTTELFQPFE